MSRRNARIAIFGGSFDPPHLGHRLAVEGLFHHPGIDRVWVLPSGNPPWKQTSASALERLEMTRLAFNGLDDVKVLDTEIALASRHPGQKTTTWAVLEALHTELHGAEPLWIIGADQVLALENWSRFPELLGQCHWLILLRRGEGHSPDAVFRKLNEFEASGLLRPEPGRGKQIWTVHPDLSGGKRITVEVIPTEAPEVSSTRIREELARIGAPLTTVTNGWLQPAVAQYLKEKKLYGTGSHDL